MISPQYLAGLIDGEGYLGLLPCRTKGLKNPSFEPVIKIGMTGSMAYEIMTLLREQYHGSIEQRPVLTKGGRIAYMLTIKSKKTVYKMLSDIYPYLFVKRSQAELLMEFCKLPMTHSRHASFDPKVLARKVAIAKEMINLKKPEPLATTE